MTLFNQRKQHIPSTLLHAKYGWPPFSVLNTQSWDWQRRRDEWENLFKDSTVGRDVKRYNATPTNIFSARGAQAKKPESVSEFDAYLCELMYKWFSREGDMILDPFAGGCVRGLVASVLNRHYCGIDLSDYQVNTNIAQFNSIYEKYTGIKYLPSWICADAADVEFVTSDKRFDMIFTCPPYHNLERYTDDPRDLSNMADYKQFLVKYGDILKSSANILKDDSFFVIVVSEIRADASNVSKSYYRGFVADTIQILRDFCGLQYYNDIILENSLGSLPIRAPKYFDRFRKIGRHHQNILVFYKGDILNIERKFGPVVM